jgi:flavin reductase (DIM6/NTAB) family NADH-FMN oxidoreductase RutF
MKKILCFTLLVGLLAACADNQTKPTVEVKDKAFSDLFRPITAVEMTGNVFKLVGQDFTVITAGTEADYNSMTASWGGWGILFEEPVTWCFLRANRYTLEYMKKSETYTMTYFDDQYKDQVMLFGTKSGRDTDKMKEHKLTPVLTPSGNMAYKEAKLIIECALGEVTSVHPDDFYAEKGRTFVEDAYEEVNDYHKLIFGKITMIWVKK